jgi:hypothetical protein
LTIVEPLGVQGVQRLDVDRAAVVCDFDLSRLVEVEMSGSAGLFSVAQA